PAALIRRLRNRSVSPRQHQNRSEADHHPDTTVPIRKKMAVGRQRSTYPGRYELNPATPAIIRPIHRMRASSRDSPHTSPNSKLTAVVIPGTRATELIML